MNDTATRASRLLCQSVILRATALSTGRLVEANLSLTAIEEVACERYRLLLGTAIAMHGRSKHCTGQLSLIDPRGVPNNLV